MKVEVYCDGLCSPNPGTGTWAFKVFIDKAEWCQDYGVLLAPCTNNVAEYTAVLKAVEYLAANLELVGAGGYFDVWTDSELVAKQVSREWECNKDNLREMRDEIIAKLNVLDTVSVKWIPGSTNKADALTRYAFREATGKEPIDYSLWKKKRR